MKKRALSILLSALLVLPLWASCSEKNAEEGPKDSAGAPSASDAVPGEPEPETEDPGLDDGLPEVDYEGYTYHICHWGEKVNIEEETGEALNDAIFRRNQALEERFDITVEGVDFDDYNAATTAVKNAVTAGVNDFDVAFLHMVSAGQAAPGGYFFSLDLLDAVHPEKPWWDTD